jgi:crotonobetainyl-CoA:carnitine CoA-transferase CaiB-like acyl-CoA transferase
LVGSSPSSIDTLLEACNDTDVLANGYVTEVAHPQHGKTLKAPRLAVVLLRNAGHMVSPWNSARINDAVLAELGYTPAQIEDFRERKII